MSGANASPVGRSKYAMRLLAIASVAALVSASQVQPVPGAASIEGIVVKIGAADVRLQFPGQDNRVVERVVVDQGGTPLAGATVELTGIVGTQVRSYVTRTGVDGRFVLHNIPPGQGYQLIAIHSPEYLTAQYGQTVPGLPGSPLSVLAGQQMKDVRIAMWPGAQVSGRVLDRTGMPVRAAVTAYKPWYWESWRVLSQTVDRSKSGVVARVETNNRGEYRFQELPAGQYYFHAVSTSGIQIGQVRGYGFAAYYGASKPGDEADPVDLDLGEVVTGLDIVGDLMLPSQIRGQAVDRRTGMPIPASQLSLIPRGGLPDALSEGIPGGVSVGVSVPDPNSFSIAVHPGSYVLTAFARGVAGRVNVDVGSSGVVAVQVPLNPLIDIAGRVTVDGGRSDIFAAGSAPVKVILRSLAAPIPNKEIRVSSDGTFQLRGIPAGDYRVDVHPFLSVPVEENVPAAWKDLYVRSIRLGSDDILNDSAGSAGGLHIESPSTNRLEIVVGTNGGTLEGRILDSKKNAIANARAVLVPDAARRRRGDLYKTAPTDDAGRYEIRGIAPGNYKVYAWELVEHGAWQDPNFIKLHETRGTSVRVREGSRQTVDTPLIRVLN